MANTLHLAADHAGFELKEVLKKTLEKQGYQVIDHGTKSPESCDYPLFAHSLCQAVLKDQSLGLLICGSGLGMSMAANRHKGIRAALCSTELAAKLSREHNNANVLCLGARLTGQDLALAIVRAFLAGTFQGGRHERRVALIEP